MSSKAAGENFLLFLSLIKSNINNTSIRDLSLLRILVVDCVAYPGPVYTREKWEVEKLHHFFGDAVTGDESITNKIKKAYYSCNQIHGTSPHMVL